MHHQGATSGSDQDAYPTGFDYSNWHTAIIEWGPNRCAFILDGITLGISTSRVPNTPMHWVIQTETWLRKNSTGAYQKPDPTAVAHVYVDWVAVWRPA